MDDLEQDISSLIGKCYELESELQQAQDESIKKYLEDGIQVDPKALINIIDLTHTRMLKLYIAKVLAHKMGLQEEWPVILRKELDLLFAANDRPSYSPKVVGEAK